MEDNLLTGYPIDKHQNQSPNVEGTDTNTSTNQQQDIVEIEKISGSDSEGSAIRGDSYEGTDDADDEVEPVLWLIDIIPLLLLFQKVSIPFIVVFGAYLANDEIIIIFSGRSSQTHIMNNKPVK